MSKYRHLFLHALAAVLFIQFGSSLSFADQGSVRNASGDSQAALNSYDSVLGDLDLRIASFRKRADDRHGEWLPAEFLGKALHERALLTGRVEDLGQSLEILENSFKVAPKGSGPALTTARVCLSLHKLEKAQYYLGISENWKLLPVKNRASNFQISGTISLYKGDYEEALEKFRNCELLVAGQCLADLATYYQNTGGYSEAEAIYHRMLSNSVSDQRQHRAWINLQLAILMMKRGQYEQALGYLQQSDRELPGWWLVREHIAEVSGLLGKPDDSIAIYQRVIAETNFPQFMDSLADIYSEKGKVQEAKELSERAKSIWQEKLGLFPEALSAHALKHFLSDKSEVAFALELAEKNFKNRPWGESAVLLAEAYLENNQPDKAAQTLEQVLGSKYRSAELYEVASRVYRKVDQEGKAEKFQNLCQQLNPKICSAAQS